MTTPEEEADKITLIDNSVTWFAIATEYLSPAQVEALSEHWGNNARVRLRSRGFQEVLGYVGRQCVLSMGGVWRENEKQFYVTSFGGRTEAGDEVYTEDDGIGRGGETEPHPWPKDDTPPPAPPSHIDHHHYGVPAWMAVLYFILVVGCAVAAGVYAGKRTQARPLPCPECERRQAEALKVANQMYEAFFKAIQASKTETPANYMQLDTESRGAIEKARLEYEENIRKIEAER